MKDVFVFCVELSSKTGSEIVDIFFIPKRKYKKNALNSLTSLQHVFPRSACHVGMMQTRHPHIQPEKPPLLCSNTVAQLRRISLLFKSMIRFLNGFKQEGKCRNKDAKEDTQSLAQTNKADFNASL